MVFFMVTPPGANIRPPTSTTALDRSSARSSTPSRSQTAYRTEGTDSDLDPRLPATAHILGVVISRHVDRRFHALTMRIAWRHVARTEHVNRPPARILAGKEAGLPEELVEGGAVTDER